MIEIFDNGHFLKGVNFYIYIDATIYVGGLDDKVSETLLWELFLQSGPVGECISTLYAGSCLCCEMHSKP